MTPEELDQGIATLGVRVTELERTISRVLEILEARAAREEQLTEAVRVSGALMGALPRFRASDRPAGSGAHSLCPRS
jgi:hypothetical protein